MNEQNKNQNEPMSPLFTPLRLPHITLKNRLIRSATYEGHGDANGYPLPSLAELYGKLAVGGVGAIITGFVYVSQTGRAMHPRQCGIDSDDKIMPWQHIIRRAKEIDDSVKIFMQLAHTGRQTLQKATGRPVVGVSKKKCGYFRQKVEVLDEESIHEIIAEFANAAERAKAAGFDGVQIHAAHGYLIHQFLSPWTNNRSDRWRDGVLFLLEIIRAMRSKCGCNFPVLVKLSWSEDQHPGIDLAQTVATITRLQALDVDGVEISYGTMENALNIIRGDCPVDTILKVNPIFNRMPPILRKLWKRLFLGRYLKRVMPFKEDYNLDASVQIAARIELPVIAVGGLRAAESMVEGLDRGIAAVSLCRPLICEPDLPKKISNGKSDRSRCMNCNLCTAHVDSKRPLQCYQGNALVEDGGKSFQYKTLAY